MDASLTAHAVRSFSAFIMTILESEIKSKWRRTCETSLPPSLGGDVAAWSSAANKCQCPLQLHLISLPLGDRGGFLPRGRTRSADGEAY
jgi:hypothetical protein